MRLRGLAVVAAGLALVATTALPARAAREVSATYVTGTDPIAAGTMAVVAGIGPFESACAAQPGSPTAGGVCLAVEGGETRARVRVVDATGLPVSGDIAFYDAAGERLYPWTTSFCRRTDVAIPSRAAYVHVGVDASTLRCGIGSGVGTTGTVVAFFS